MNDPNGLVLVDGEWHLYFQANPAACDWGDIAWGHAVSRDLVAWEPRPVALRPYPARVPGATTLVFSGSVVSAAAADGRGTELRAYFTAHERRGDQPLNESVALARSADGGRTWTHHPGGPLIDRGQVDFRDPKVFRHGPDGDGDGGAWVLVIAAAAERRVLIYRSADGLAWREVGAFADPAEGSWLWECPDLFEVPVRGGPGPSGNGGSRWVLVVSGAHPAGPPYTGMTYWVGDFDGERFVADAAGPRPFEHGKDFFAGVTYHGLPAGAEPVMVGWASNWAYARATPAPGWRGAMALPRRLWLDDDGTGTLVLAQAPAEPVEAALAAAAGPPVVGSTAPGRGPPGTGLTGPAGRCWRPTSGSRLRPAPGRAGCGSSSGRRNGLRSGPTPTPGGCGSTGARAPRVNRSTRRSCRSTRRRYRRGPAPTPGSG